MAAQKAKRSALYRVFWAHALDPAGQPEPESHPAFKALYESAKSLCDAWGPEATVEVLQTITRGILESAEAGKPKRGRGAPSGPRKPEKRTFLRNVLLDAWADAGADGLPRPNLKALARALKRSGAFVETEDAIYRALHREAKVMHEEWAKGAFDLSDSQATNVLAALAKKSDE